MKIDGIDFLNASSGGLVRADAFGAVIRGVCGHGAGIKVVVVEWFEGEAAGVGRVVVGILTEQ